MSREIDKWNHLAVLKNVSCSWQRGKQNTKVKWSEVQQGENGGGDRGAGKEVDDPGSWVVL